MQLRLLSLTLTCLVAIASLGHVSASDIEARAFRPSPFSTAAAKYYQVGHSLPIKGMKDKVPLSWAGMMPLMPNHSLKSKAIDALRFKEKDRNSNSLYFWFWEAENGVHSSDDLVLWLTGGPGCSSLFGLFNENGPIVYTDTRKGPKLNPNTWTKHANMIWLDQPGSTGFSSHNVTFPTEKQVAADIHAFIANFRRAFPEVRKKRFWITGESYAGRYIPHTENYFYNSKDSFNLKGSLYINGFIAEPEVQQYMPVYQQSKGLADVMRLSEKTLAEMKKEAASPRCGYTQIFDKMTFPAKGHFPSSVATENCNVTSIWYKAITKANPFFNVYDIRFRGPGEADAYNPMGDPNNPSVAKFLSNRKMQDYIHAPHRDFIVCGNAWDGSFEGDDEIVIPTRELIPANLARSTRSIIAHGIYDGLLFGNGTLLTLQNMTWLGQQGFDEPPIKPFKDIHGKVAGHYTYGRKLAFVADHRSGHMIPENDRLGGRALLQALLGHRRLDGSKMIDGEAF